MTVDYGRGEGNVVIQGVVGAEVIPKKVAEAKVDTREPLWEELEAKSIKFKKNMSKAKLEELLK